MGGGGGGMVVVPPECVPGSSSRGHTTTHQGLNIYVYIAIPICFAVLCISLALCSCCYNRWRFRWWCCRPRRRKSFVQNSYNVINSSPSPTQSHNPFQAGERPERGIIINREGMAHSMWCLWLTHGLAELLD